MKRVSNPPPPLPKRPATEVERAVNPRPTQTVKPPPPPPPPPLQK